MPYHCFTRYAVHGIWTSIPQFAIFVLEVSMSVYKEIIEHKVPTYKKGDTNEDVFVRELFTQYS